jgi:hypothetical protein
MKIHRISLSAESYARLSYISAIEQISPKDWMEQRIEDAWSHRDKKAENPIIQLDDKPKCGAVPVADIPRLAEEHKGTTIDLKNPSGKGHKGTSAKVPTGKKLSEDPIALAKLKELYRQDPRPSLAAIGQEIGYPRVTVHDNINRMKKRGEL